MILQKRHIVDTTLCRRRWRVNRRQNRTGCGLWASGFRYVRLLASDFRLWASGFGIAGLQAWASGTSDYWLRTSGFGLPASGTSDYWLWTSALRQDCDHLDDGARS